jgi:hypothetical protein
MNMYHSNIFQKISFPPIFMCCCACVLLSVFFKCYSGYFSFAGVLVIFSPQSLCSLCSHVFVLWFVSFYFAYKTLLLLPSLKTFEIIYKIKYMLATAHFLFNVKHLFPFFPFLSFFFFFHAFFKNF